MNLCPYPPKVYSNYTIHIVLREMIDMVISMIGWWLMGSLVAICLLMMLRAICVDDKCVCKGVSCCRIYDKGLLQRYS